MTRVEIRKLAKEAQLPFNWGTGEITFLDQLEQFTNSVLQVERERCAKIVENYCGAWDDEGYALIQAIRKSK